MEFIEWLIGSAVEVGEHEIEYRKMKALEIIAEELIRFNNKTNKIIRNDNLQVQ